MDLIGYISDKNREQVILENIGEQAYSVIKLKLNTYFNDLISEIDEKKLDYLKLVTYLSKRAEKEYISGLPPYEQYNREVELITDDNINQAFEEIRVLSEVGFDTESEPTFKKGQPHNIVSVIQMCSKNKCYIFQMNKITQTKNLSRILNDHRIKKVGVGLQGDSERLEDDYGFEVSGIVNIDEIFKKLGSKEVIGAKQMVAIVLNKQLKKSKNISRSNWATEELTQRQLSYASDDVFCAIDVYYELQRLLSDYSDNLTKRIIKLLGIKDNDD